MFNTNSSIRKIIKFLFSCVLVVFVVSTAQASGPETTPRHHIKDGLAIYLGMLPAEMIEGHTARSMHGGLPTGPYRYHLTIAIFDDKTGKRVNNAKVMIRVNNRIGVGPDTFKELEGMKLNEQYMYGNYFLFKTAGPYRIDVKVIRSKTNKPIHVSFDYDFAQT